MKRAAQILIFSLVLLFLANRSVWAQDFDFAKAYQDYIFTQTTYDQAHSDYDKAKNEYLKNPTLTLKEAARIKTLTMLKQRDELLRVYLLALRMKLFEIKVAIPSKLDDEIAWYKDHQSNYKDGDPLEDLFNKSKESQSRYKSDSSPILYETLFNISFGEMNNIRLHQADIYKSLKNSIDLAVSAGLLKIDPFNRWFGDIDNIFGQIDQINTKSQARIAKMYESTSTNPAAAFNSAISLLIPGVTKLTELNDYLGEFLNSINSHLTQP